MSTLIRGGTIVTGDGVTNPRLGAVIVSGGLITEVLGHWDATRNFSGTIIDATGCVVMPGLINSHTHGVTGGILLPSAAPSLPRDAWMANLDRHLLAGTTTVLSQCGFNSMGDVAEADRQHAVHVRGATSFVPHAVEAARKSDGAGFDERSIHSTIEHALEAGAIAIGELGGGQTLGGGGQELKYIPDALERHTGIRVSPGQARALKDAALGRFLDIRDGDLAALVAAADDAGLTGHLSVGGLRDIIARTVMPSVVPAIQGIREGVRAAARLGVPAIVHSASATARVMRELMDELPGPGVTVIAAHANHPSHTPAEALALAMACKEFGWPVEVSVFDLLHRKHTVASREHWDVLLCEPGLVDVLATDFGFEGNHDELISAVQDVASHRYRSLAGAVAMATSTVAELIPGIAPNGGLIRQGYIADVVVTDAEDFRAVKHVIVDGRLVVSDGNLTREAHR